MPGNVSVLYQKKLEGASRSRRDGRMYLVGVSEAFTPSTGPNLIDATTFATLNTRGAAFLDAINGTHSVGGNNYQSFLCVAHILTRDADGNPLTGDSTDVASMVASQTLATQRRRLRA